MAGGLTISTLNDSSGVLATQNGMSGIAKAWVNFNGANGSIRASFNVGSVTRNSTGDYTVNFTTAMPDANYVAVGTAGKNGTGGNTFLCDTQYYAPTTSGQRMLTFNYSNGTLSDAPMVSVSVFR